MGVPGTKPQDFNTEIVTTNADKFPYIKDAATTPLDRNITPGDFLSSQGGLTFQGAWDATANVPPLTSSTGTKGFVYHVTVAGTTSLDGIALWNINDYVYFDGLVWRQNAGAVQQVFGRTGPVVATASDYDASQVDNDSGVAGSTVKDALDTLDNQGSALPTVGTGGEYANVAAAITATVFDMQFISDVTDSADITIGASQDVTIDVGTFTWTTGDMKLSASGTSVIKIAGNGSLVSALTTASKDTFSLTGTSRLDLTGFRLIDGVANVGASTGISEFISGTLLDVGPVRILLSNHADSGFGFVGKGSHISDVTLVGGGSSCSGFITNGNEVLVSNLTLEGTFNSNQGPFLMTFSGTKGPILTNFINNSNNVWIKTESPKTQISNLQSNFSLDLDIASGCTLTDLNLTDLDMTDSSAIDNYFKGVNVTSDVTIEGDGNRGTNNRFVGNLIINGSTNKFGLTTAGAVINNGSANEVSNSAAVGGVSSVFTRTGVVVAAASDYDASQVDNDSTVTGATVKDALETLEAGHSAVDSVFARTGTVVATLNDYDASLVNNDSSVSGATVKDALETIGAAERVQRFTQSFVDLPTGPPVATFTLVAGAMYFCNIITTGGDDGSFILTVGDKVVDGATRYKYALNNEANAIITGGPSAFTIAVQGQAYQYVWTLSQADLTSTLNAATATATGTSIFNIIRIDPN